ncbi:hypothetical protein Ancab_029539 [Ancistrocladus abbreviatus]
MTANTHSTQIQEWIPQVGFLGCKVRSMGVNPILISSDDPGELRRLVAHDAFLHRVERLREWSPKEVGMARMEHRTKCISSQTWSVSPTVSMVPCTPEEGIQTSSKNGRTNATSNGKGGSDGAVCRCNVDRGIVEPDVTCHIGHRARCLQKSPAKSTLHRSSTRPAQ